MNLEQCCGHKRSIQNWDFVVNGDVQVPYVNRMCVNCKTHWHGPESDVTEYTAREWDALMEAAA